MARGDFILGIVFLALVVGLGLTSIALTKDAGNLAQWASAIMSALAIGAAIWNANLAMSAERNRNRARAQICAHSIAPYAIEINNRVHHVMTYAQQENYGLRRMSDPRGFPENVLAALDIATAIPKDAFNDAWTLPPELARFCLLMRFMTLQYQSLVRTQLPRIRELTAAQHVTYVNAMIISLNGVWHNSLEARKGLEALLGEPLGRAG